MDQYYSGYGFELWETVNELGDDNIISDFVRFHTLNQLKANVFYMLYLNDDNDLEIKTKE